MARGRIPCLNPFSRLGFGLVWDYTGLVYTFETTLGASMQLPCCVQKTQFPVVTHPLCLVHSLHPVSCSDL